MFGGRSFVKIPPAEPSYLFGPSGPPTAEQLRVGAERRRLQSLKASRGRPATPADACSHPGNVHYQRMVVWPIFADFRKEQEATLPARKLLGLKRQAAMRREAVRSAAARLAGPARGVPRQRDQGIVVVARDGGSGGGGGRGMRVEAYARRAFATDWRPLAMEVRKENPSVMGRAGGVDSVLDACWLELGRSERHRYHTEALNLLSRQELLGQVPRQGSRERQRADGAHSGGGGKASGSGSGGGSGGGGGSGSGVGARPWHKPPPSVDLRPAYWGKEAERLLGELRRLVALQVREDPSRCCRHRSLKQIHAAHPSAILAE